MHVLIFAKELTSIATMWVHNTCAAIAFVGTSMAGVGLWNFVMPFTVAATTTTIQPLALLYGFAVKIGIGSLLALLRQKSI